MDQYIYPNGKLDMEPVVYTDQDWTDTDIQGVQTWTSPDGKWTKVRQTMQWDFFRGTWPITQRRMNTIAKRNVEGAKCHQDTMMGVDIHSVWTRVYRAQ